MPKGPLLLVRSAPRFLLGSLMGGIKAASGCLVCQEYGTTGRDFILSVTLAEQLQQRRPKVSLYPQTDARDEAVEKVKNGGKTPFMIFAYCSRHVCLAF
jgi:hypothetical protein